MIDPKRLIRIIIKAERCDVTIIEKNGGLMSAMAMGYIEADALEGTEITKDEFKKQFDEAARLIVFGD